MEKVFHKALKVNYQSEASCDDPMLLNNSAALHQRQLEFLLMKIYKSTGILNPQLIRSYLRLV